MVFLPRGLADQLDGILRRAFELSRLNPADQAEPVHFLGCSFNPRHDWLCRRYGKNSILLEMLVQ